MAAQVIGAVVRGIGRGGGPIHPRCRIGGRVMRGVAWHRGRLRVAGFLQRHEYCRQPLQRQDKHQHQDKMRAQCFHKILFKNKCLHNSPQGVPWRAPAGINASIAEDPQCRARFPRRGLRRKTRTTRLRLNLQIQHHALILVFKIVAEIGRAHV